MTRPPCECKDQASLQNECAQPHRCHQQPDLDEACPVWLPARWLHNASHACVRTKSRTRDSAESHLAGYCGTRRRTMEGDFWEGPSAPREVRLQIRAEVGAQGSNSDEQRCRLRRYLRECTLRRRGVKQVDETDPHHRLPDVRDWSTRLGKSLDPQTSGRHGRPSARPPTETSRSSSPNGGQSRNAGTISRHRPSSPSHTNRYLTISRKSVLSGHRRPDLLASPLLYTPWKPIRPTHRLCGHVNIFVLCRRTVHVCCVFLA